MRKKMNILLLDITDCGLNIKYLGSFEKFVVSVVDHCQLQGVDEVTGRYLWGCWNLSRTEKPSIIFTFASVSLLLQACLRFWNKHPLPSSECCVLLGSSYCPAARGSVLLASPISHPVSWHLQRLFGEMGACRVFWPALKHVFPPLLNYFSGMGSWWGCQ